MRGTVLPVNRAMLRPLLVGGVEKQMLLLNFVVCFPLIAVTHLQMPECLVGVGAFLVFHFMLKLVTKYDPMLAKLFKRATRYLWQPYFPARSHPAYMNIQPIKSVSRPW